MISEKAFRKYVNQPKPIAIHLADGRQINVPHGEHIAVEPGGADVSDVAAGRRLRIVQPDDSHLNQVRRSKGRLLP